MKKATLLLTAVIFFFLISNGANAQKKDTIPPVRQYVFTIAAPTFSIIDSILQRSYHNVGKAMLLEEGELLKQNLAAVIQYFLMEKSKQDSAFLKPKKNP